LLAASASALLGDGVDDSPDSSPTQIGGTVSITADGGFMSLNDVDAAATAETFSA
jgi:hypothetical protein